MMQSEVERLALKALGSQGKSFGALGTTRSTFQWDQFMSEI